MDSRGGVSTTFTKGAAHVTIACGVQNRQDARALQSGNGSIKKAHPVTGWAN
jgi:hypothetical protein